MTILVEYKKKRGKKIVIKKNIYNTSLMRLEKRKINITLGFGTSIW